MDTKKIAIPALLAALLLAAGAYADADEPTTWDCPGYGLQEDFVPPGWQVLTDEQLKTMLEKHLGLLEEGLDRADIHKEMQEFRAEQGIQSPYFVDEDGDGICDYAGQRFGGSGYGRGHGQGCGMGRGRGMGPGMGHGFGHMRSR